MLPDVVEVRNRGNNVDLHEKENDAIDHEQTLWQALQAVAP